MKRALFSLPILFLGGCAAFKAPTRAPDSIVGNSATNLAIAEYIQATSNLAKAMGIDVPISETLSADFLGSIGNIEKLDSRLLQGSPRERTNFKLNSLATISPVGSVDDAFKKFIVVGQETASMLCRSYVRGLADKDAGIEALKSEFGAISTLTNAAFKIFKASAKSGNVYNILSNFALSSITNYEELAYLKPQLTSTLDLVLGAQSVLTKYYIGEGNPEVKTLAGALNIMHNIEYQCSIVGMQSLIDNSARDSARILEVVPGGAIRVKKEVN